MHYHGTPITPAPVLARLAGRNFCVSFAEPRDLKTCLAIGQAVMGDSGAFSTYTRGHQMDWPAYFEWLQPWLRPPHWAVAPDVIGGDVDAQRDVQGAWPFDRALGAAVWHIHLPLDWLAELVDTWPRVAFGSSGEFWEIGTDAWRGRIDAAWNFLARRGAIPNIHMLRAMRQASEGPWPFASADSTSVARNHAGAPSRGTPRRDAGLMAAAIDARNPRAEFRIRPEQLGLLPVEGEK